MESDDLQEINLDEMDSQSIKPSEGIKSGKEHKSGKAVLGFLKKFRVILIILILAVIGICLFLNYRKKQEQMAAMMQTAQTETATLEKRNLTSSITTTGTVQSMESRVVKSALTKTELSEVNVEVGDTVEAGQVIAVFKDEDIRTDIARIEDKINVSEQTEAIDSQATDREYVYTYGSQAVSITEAQEKVDDALRDLNEACDGYGDAKRKLQAAKDEGKSDTEITQLENAVSTAYQSEIKAQDAYEEALQAQAEALRNANNTLASTDENYQKTSLTKGDSTEELEQQLEDLQTSLDNCVVTAPISGIVTSLAVKSGDTYVDGEIMTIQNCDTYTISAQIDEYDISDLKEGMEVVIKTDATRDDELEGVVSFISPTATASASGTSSTDATYEVTIDILTKDDRLKLGMTAKLNIIVDEVENVLTVPYDAISTNAAGENVVYIVEGGVQPRMDGAQPTKGGTTNGDHTVEQREVVVEIGMESDYYTQIISDELTEGMIVAIPSAAGEGSSTEESAMTFNMGGMGGGMGGGAPAGGGPSGGGMP